MEAVSVAWFDGVVVASADQISLEVPTRVLAWMLAWLGSFAAGTAMYHPGDCPSWYMTRYQVEVLTCVTYAEDVVQCVVEAGARLAECCK